MYVNLYTSLALIIFYFKYPVMQSNFQTRTEKFNEIVLFFSNYMMIFFTEFIRDAELRYEIGFMMSYLVLMIIAINIVLVLLDMVIGLLLWHKKRVHAKAWDNFH